MLQKQILTFNCECVKNLSAFITVPKDFDAEQENLPLIVFLHGAGERGSSDETTEAKIRTHGIPNIFGNDPDYHGLRVVTLSPQCPNDMLWDHFVPSVKKLIDTVVAQYHINTDKISITGISMGGFGTWDMIATYPDFFSCAAPVCGGGCSWTLYSLKKGFPIWAFHGDMDDVVPLAYGKIMTQRALQVGANVKFTVFPGVQHNSWEMAYGQTDLIEWLVSNSRQ